MQPLGSSQHFMEPEGSLPSSQELSTCTYPEPNQSISMEMKEKLVVGPRWWPDARTGRLNIGSKTTLTLTLQSVENQRTFRSKMHL
jgi:hypothetical protein